VLAEVAHPLPPLESPARTRRTVRAAANSPFLLSNQDPFPTKRPDEPRTLTYARRRARLNVHYRSHNRRDVMSASKTSSRRIERPSFRWNGSWLERRNGELAAALTVRRVRAGLSSGGNGCATSASTSAGYSTAGSTTAAVAPRSGLPWDQRHSKGLFPHSSKRCKWF